MGRMMVFILVVMAIIGLFATVLSVFSGLVNPEQFVWPAFFGLGFWLIFIYDVLVFLALLLLWSKKVWIAVLVLLVAVPGLLKSFSYSKVQGEGLFRVMSYNVLGFKDFRNESTSKVEVASHMAEFVREMRPDVLCIQEFGPFLTKTSRAQCIEELGEMMGMPYHYYHRKANFGGNVIFSRYPLRPVDDGTPFASENYYGAVAQVDAGDKGTFWVLNCHLRSFQLTDQEITVLSEPGNSKEEVQEYGKSVISKLGRAYKSRSQEVQQMIDHLPQDGRPLLVCGDLNDTPLSYTSYQLARNGFKDGFREAGRGLGRTYAGKLPLLRIDYVWGNGPIQPTSFRRVKYRGSDHYPVMMDFNISNVN